MGCVAVAVMKALWGLCILESASKLLVVAMLVWASVVESRRDVVFSGEDHAVVQIRPNWGPLSLVSSDYIARPKPHLPTTRHFGSNALVHVVEAVVAAAVLEALAVGMS